MKYFLTLVHLLIISSAYASQTLTDCDDVCSKLSGTIFSNKPLSKSHDAYSIKDEHGLCGEDDSCQDYLGKLGSRKATITISLTSGAFKINERQFNYQSAQLLQGAERAIEDAPLYVKAVYIAAPVKNRPDMVCLEGSYAGTSSKYNKTEVFLITNPLQIRGESNFFHLPNLHSSCLGIKQEKDNSISYPINSYIQNNNQEQNTELSTKRVLIKNK